MGYLCYIIIVVVIIIFVISGLWMMLFVVSRLIGWSCVMVCCG